VTMMPLPKGDQKGVERIPAAAARSFTGCTAAASRLLCSL